VSLTTWGIRTIFLQKLRGFKVIKHEVRDITRNAVSTRKLISPDRSGRSSGRFPAEIVFQLHDDARHVHSGLPSIAGLLPDGVGVPATTYDYLRPSQFAYTSLIL
jgi:hypothetical protein